MNGIIFALFLVSQVAAYTGYENVAWAAMGAVAALIIEDVVRSSRQRQERRQAIKRTSPNDDLTSQRGWF